MNEQLKNKIFNYNVPAPDGVWDKINNALDEELSENFTDKLIKYELAPPSSVWNKVAVSLDENEVTVIPFKKRFSKVLKYSAAAACLAGIAVLVSLLINKQSVSSETANSPGVKQNVLTIKPSNGTSPTPDTFLQNSDPVDHDLASAKKISTKKVSLLHAPASANSLEERTDYMISHNYPIQTPNELDRYIIFSTTTGEAFRLSKKLFDLFACSSNNEICRENIESMQQQMASPTMMASADFSGLMDILQNMNNQ